MTATLSASSIAELAARGKARNPQLSARFDRAAAIVLAGEYQTTSDPETVIVRGYHVNGQCECPDYLLGNAPTAHNGQRYCKHMLAKLIVVKLAASEPAEHTETGEAWQQSMAWQSFAQSYRK